jgi:hypothetical protein
MQIEKKIKGVRMKVIQNKIIITQKAFIIHIYGLHHYKGKLSKNFSAYMTFFKCGLPWWHDKYPDDQAYLVFP